MINQFLLTEKVALLNLDNQTLVPANPSDKFIYDIMSLIDAEKGERWTKIDLGEDVDWTRRLEWGLF